MEQCARFVIVAFLLFKTVNQIDGNCNLSLKEDFGSPSPVLIKNGNYLMPNTSSSVIILKTEDRVRAACPGDRRSLILASNDVGLQDAVATCVSDTTFRVGSWKGSFKDIKCNSQPWFSAEPLNKTCLGRNKMYQVGYKIRKRFYPLYELCFDGDLLTTLYVKHQLTPYSKFSQNGVKRPNFIEGDLFGKVKMSHLYKTTTQKALLNSVLGEGMDEEYISKIQFLNRGHLAPRADFSLSAAQRATFHFANAAPQWMRVNAGDWAALEEALRRRIASHGSPVTVYTGTHGVLELPDKDGRLQPLYLTTDGNNNGIVPVPKYFYKLLHDAYNKTAVAFVTINSSFYNSTMEKSLQFCSDICDENGKYSWLKWRADGAHSFCCEYEEFVSVVRYLPKLNVKALFY